MQIRELSKQAGAPAKTIRYYKDVGLLPPANRKPNGYREYEEADVERRKLVGLFNIYTAINLPVFINLLFPNA